MKKRPFFNLYSHDFVRVALAVPEVRVADPAFHARQALGLLEEAASKGAALTLFPELNLSAYTCDDLFHQGALLDACLGALDEVVEGSRGLPTLGVVGLPLRVEQSLFNCAVVFGAGRIYGVVPKTFLPNYREFYEARYFAPGSAAVTTEVALPGHAPVPFGSRTLFEVEGLPGFTFHVEICEDLWVPIPPSCEAALAGATVLLNLSASNITIGKAGYRRQLVANQSARCIAAYLYTAAGPGESTTDLAWDGHALACENGTLVAESERFRPGPRLTLADLDLARIAQERMRQTSFSDARRALGGAGAAAFRRVRAQGAKAPSRAVLLPERRYERFPYVPADPGARDERCAEAYNIQVQGLATRLRSTGLERVVLGVSGGLDSTHALVVCARAIDLLGLPRENIIGVTMPGFATSSRTREQALDLMRAVGCQALEIDIRPSSRQMLHDIGHPAGAGEPAYDVTFENVQAGERTSHLFRLANHRRALVVGTGDLSELALGWCTYGVGDHMAHYNVNASVPKTLIRYLLRWAAQTNQLGPAASAVLERIDATEISPELVPGEDEGGEPAQQTERVIGPYELNDFFLYYTLRYGYEPTKVAFLAYCAWHDRRAGAWPDVPPARQRQYDVGEIKRWLGSFLGRFFGNSQFKRSCLPNGPKVGSGGSVSPRGDWRAPSDGRPEPWLAALAEVPGEGPPGGAAG
ncbi:MAG TPA: NAD(+) synthase [Polyangiaceae bacterium]|nr:NAD(+) synthase [Polyangiaceae bacterium]